MQAVVLLLFNPARGTVKADRLDSLYSVSGETTTNTERQRHGGRDLYPLHFHPCAAGTYLLKGLHADTD